MHLRLYKPQQIRQQQTSIQNPCSIRPLRAYKTPLTIWQLLPTILTIPPRVNRGKDKIRGSKAKEKVRANRGRTKGRVKANRDRAKGSRVKVRDKVAIVEQVMARAKTNRSMFLDK